MTDNGAKALAERLAATFDGTDGQGYRLALVAEDGGVIPPPLPSLLADAILANGARFLTAEEAERLRRIEHAARDVDGLWTEGRTLIRWQVEAGEALLDLRAALTEPSHD